MRFTDKEVEYMSTQRLGRLATVQPNGSLQNSPVGFRYNAELDTVDITGHGMVTSQKFRNLSTDPRVAFVVDDVITSPRWTVRCVEIRGTGEAVPPPDVPDPTLRPGVDGAISRVHPTRIISFGLGDNDDPMRDGANKRNV